MANRDASFSPRFIDESHHGNDNFDDFDELEEFQDSSVERTDEDVRSPEEATEVDPDPCPKPRS